MAKKLTWIFVIFSILFHLGSYWASFTIDIALPVSPTKKNVEVELIERPDVAADLNKPIVRFAEAPKELVDDSLEALKKKAEVLSEKVQRVKKEMRANLFGLTKNRWQTPPQPKKDVPNNIPDRPSMEATDANGIKLKVENQNRTSNPLDLAPSTFGNQLNRKIEVGAFTAINTDRHLYYSFYARIEEMIRPPWENQVLVELKRSAQNPRHRPKGGWSTRLDVILNPKGELLKVVLLKGSGVAGYDSAAIDAFQKAGFFPHPPKEMVGEDGRITLKYIFTVY